jgi:CHAT domain-containing protein
LSGFGSSTCYKLATFHPFPATLKQEVRRMLNIRIASPLSAASVFLVLAGWLVLLFALNGQASQAFAQPAARGQKAPAGGAQLPAEAQAELDKLNDALKEAQAEDDTDAEAKTLNQIGAAYVRFSDDGKAMQAYKAALAQARMAKDAQQEAAALNGIADCDSNQAEFSSALDLFHKARDLAAASGDAKGQATAQKGLGWIFRNLGRNKDALQSESQALALFREAGDRTGEAGALNNIGITYEDSGEEQTALEYYGQALKVRQDIHDRDGEAWTLTNMGNVFKTLADPLKAAGYYSQALPIFRAASDRAGEAAALTNMGAAYRAQGDLRKALQSYREALPVFRQINHRREEAVTLCNIGNVYEPLGEKQKALEYYKLALPIRREVGDLGGEATTLSNIGNVYDDLQERQVALSYYSQALPLALAVGSPIREAQLFRNLMMNRASAQPALAIFYGKQAIDFVQQVRRNIQGLDGELQKGFITSKEEFYRELAALLIAQGRLPEAEQVLDLLKRQEYSDYVRGEAANTLGPVLRTPGEKQADEDYQRSTARVVAGGQELARLKSTPADKRTPEQEERMRTCTEEIRAANRGLRDYYVRLFKFLGPKDEANMRLNEVKEHAGALQNQLENSPHTVALYTLVTSDGYKVIVVTGDAMVAREYAISKEELNKKVWGFQQVLKSPSQDPKPLARELYKILIGPVRADLDEAQAQTLVWSLDGVLRYIPMAALYDGTQFIVEKYSTVTITPESLSNLDKNPVVSDLRVAAMGISRQYEPSLPALPAVAGELSGIVTDPKAQGAHGVLPGTILLDGQFTERAMEDQLSKKPNVVHIASHFVFNSGDDNQSYLLLAPETEGGAAYHLTVADFGDNPNLKLSEVDLLTLSACETGMSGNASNGMEVDGLGTTAQRKGARAVVSTLWNVMDDSTGAMMADFYQRWMKSPGVGKADALRQAQLDLLQGNIKTQTGTSGRGFGTAKPEKNLLPGYEHPFYWASFVLMGNWR